MIAKQKKKNKIHIHHAAESDPPIAVLLARCSEDFESFGLGRETFK